MKKSDQLEIQKRLRIIQEWILQDYLTSDIITQCVSKWGISDRQGFRYLEMANEGFIKITEQRLEKRLAYHIQRRQKLLRDIDTKTKNSPAGISTALNILEDIAKLEKLYTTKIELTGKDGQPIQPSTTTVIIENPYTQRD